MALVARSDLGGIVVNSRKCDRIVYPPPGMGDRSDRDSDRDPIYPLLSAIPARNLGSPPPPTINIGDRSFFDEIFA
ncbi:hypothetical protein AB3M80_04765 [Arthrospira platensis BEA 1257B]